MRSLGLWLAVWLGILGVGVEARGEEPAALPLEEVVAGLNAPRGRERAAMLQAWRKYASDIPKLTSVFARLLTDDAPVVTTLPPDEVVLAPVKYYALRVLLDSGERHPALTPHFMRLLDDRDPRVAREAAVAWVRSSPDALPPVIYLCQGAELLPRQRNDFLRSLAGCRTSWHADEIRRTLRMCTAWDDPADRFGAVRVYVNLPSVYELDFITNVLAAEKVPQTRELMAYTFARMSWPPARAELYSMMKSELASPDKEKRLSAIRVIAQLDECGTEECAIAAIEDEREAKVRQAMMRELARFRRRSPRSVRAIIEWMDHADTAVRGGAILAAPHLKIGRDEVMRELERRQGDVEFNLRDLAGSTLAGMRRVDERAKQKSQPRAGD